MAGPIFSNNASGTLAASYNTAATAITLTAGQGLKFPSPPAGEWFMATIVDAANNIEIVKVTSKNIDTFTVVRAQEGTVARALNAGDKIENRLTAGALLDIKNAPADPTQIPDGSLITRMFADGSITLVKMALNSVAAGNINDGNVTAPKLAAGVAVANLGFTPVRQGGGIGQLNSIVMIGWTNASKLGLQVDNNVSLGFILTEQPDAAAGSAGYRGIPPNIQNADYTFGLTDCGAAVHHGAGTNVYTVPTEAVPIPPGSAIQIINRGGALTITPGAGVIVVWVPNGRQGACVLTAPGICTIEKASANEWYIYGAGLS